MINSRKTSRKVKVLSKIFVAVLLTLLVFDTSKTLIQAAGNYHDTIFEFSIDSDYVEMTEVTTPYREKWDDTSCYLYNVTSNGHLSYFHVYGTSDGEAHDCTCYNYWNGQRACYPGEAVFITNWVYERGYSNAAIMFDPGNGSHNYVRVFWSPDSI